MDMEWLCVQMYISILYRSHYRCAIASIWFVVILCFSFHFGGWLIFYMFLGFLPVIIVKLMTYCSSAISNSIEQGIRNRMVSLCSSELLYLCAFLFLCDMWICTTKIEWEVSFSLSLFLSPILELSRQIIDKRITFTSAFLCLIAMCHNCVYLVLFLIRHSSVSPLKAIAMHYNDIMRFVIWTPINLLLIWMALFAREMQYEF